jgi:acyl-CoA reductase-like NAD-dependent aldehyde dehydrogenase
MKVKTINPATEDLIAEYYNMKEDVNNRVSKAKHAFTEWKNNYHTRAEFCITETALAELYVL